MEYIIIAFLVILIGFAFFIYKKLDQSKESDEFSSKYAVLAEKLVPFEKLTSRFFGLILVFWGSYLIFI